MVVVERKTHSLFYRNRELLKNVSLAYILKALAMVITLFNVPSFINYFNDQLVLGAWYTLSAVLNWIVFFDFGIGNGLRNNLVAAINENDNEKIQKYTSSAYIIVGFISIVLMAIGIILLKMVNWNSFLGISNELISPDKLTFSVIAFFIGIIFNFWLKLITSILYALQKTFYPSFFVLVSSLSLLIFTMFFKIGNIEEKLIRICIVQIIVLNAPLIIATICVFSTKLKNACPSFRYYDMGSAKKISGLGMNFFVIQISLLIISSTNEFLITRLYSGDRVVQYQIYSKLFVSILVFFSLLTQPLWSAITKAYVERKYNWIKKIYRTCNILAVFGAFVCIVMVFSFQLIVNVWLRDKAIQVEYMTALLFAFFISATMFNNSSTCVANGIGKIKCQLICTTIGAILKIPLAYIFSLYIHNWTAIILATILASMPLFIAQPICIRSILEKLDNS